MTRAPTHDPEAAQKITARIAELSDWRGDTLAHVRALIHQTLPDVIEDWKWRGVPVWCHNGILCTGETYKTAVKLTFAKGAALREHGLTSLKEVRMCVLEVDGTISVIPIESTVHRTRRHFRALHLQ